MNSKCISSSFVFTTWTCHVCERLNELDRDGYTNISNGKDKCRNWEIFPTESLLFTNINTVLVLFGSVWVKRNERRRECKRERVQFRWRFLCCVVVSFFVQFWIVLITGIHTFLSYFSNIPLLGMNCDFWLFYKSQSVDG